MTMRARDNFLSLLLLCLGALAWTSPALSLTYDFTLNGRLTEPSGKPVPGPIAMKVSFFQSAAGGSAVLTVTSGLEAVPLSEGVLHLLA